MEIAFSQLITWVISTFMWDMAVFSNVWLWIPLCIPAFFFLIFFLFKWAIITAPIWIPFHLIFFGFREKNKEE